MRIGLALCITAVLPAQEPPGAASDVNLFLAGYMRELLDADREGARKLYSEAMAADDLPDFLPWVRKDDA